MQSARLINKLHGAGIPSSMSFKSDNYLNYPDVKGVDVIFKNPTGTSSYSLSNSSSSNIEFFIDNYHAVDPKSVALYFKCTVTGTTASAGTVHLCNYAHSVIQGITANFEGASGAAIEDNQNYNVFCSMMFQFFGTNYIEKVMGAIGGYSTTITERNWDGKSFTIPLELGFLQSMRTMLPMFILPRIQLVFRLTNLAQAVVSSGGLASSDATVTVTNPQLVYKRINLSDEYMNAYAKKVEKGSIEYKIAYEAWSYMGITHPGSITGSVEYPIANTHGLRRIMFSQVLAANENVTTADGINTFSRNLLGNYRFKIGGEYYPSTPINTGYTSADTGENNDASLSYYLNLLSMGVLDRNEYGLPKTSGMISAPPATDPDSDTDIAYAWNLMYDPHGTSFLNTSGRYDMNLCLYYSASSAAAKIHVFYSTLRAIRWTGPNSVEVVSDQYA